MKFHMKILMAFLIKDAIPFVFEFHPLMRGSNKRFYILKIGMLAQETMTFCYHQTLKGLRFES